MVIEDQNGNVYSNNYEKLISVYPKVTSIQIKASATAIFGSDGNNNAFYNCRSIESVTFEENPLLTTIEKYSFYRCHSLNTLDLSKCTKLSTIENNAFEETSSLHNIFFPSSLLTIGEYCFYFSDLREVTIPKSVTTINHHAFMSCLGLKRVTFEPEIDLKSIADNVFARTNLTSFSLPPSVTTFNSYALHGIPTLEKITADGNNNFQILDGILCSGDGKTLLTCPASLTSETITVPTSVNTIAACGFHSCQAKRIEIGSNVNTIGDHAIREATKLESIVFPDTIQTFPQFLMDGCINLKSVKISTGVKALPEFLFKGSGLERIEIPNTVEWISSRCFYQSILLEHVTIPSSVVYLGGGVFAGCPKVNIEFLPGSKFSVDGYGIITNGENVAQYIGKTPGSTVVISSSITTLDVACFAFNTNIRTVTFEGNSQLTKIEETAFYNCTNLESFQFPPLLTTVGSEAFMNTGLVNIEFGDKVTEFKDRAFYNCSKLQTVQFGSTTTGITFGVQIFDNCTAVESIGFPAGLTTIGKYFLRNSTSLSKVTLPGSITLIDEYAFYESGIRAVNLIQPENAYSIGLRAFYGCKNLERFKFYEGATTIGDYAFCMTKITNVEIPYTVTSLGWGCFSNCSELKSVSLAKSSTPSKLKEMGEAVFQGCLQLSVIDINNDYFCKENDAIYSKDMSKIYAFPPASDVHFISLPSKVEIISSGTFHSCKQLYTVLIPDKSILKVIGTVAFLGCSSLRSINIPYSVSTIGFNCFSECNLLSCDLVISNTNSVFRNRLVDIGKMPKKCLYPCSGCNTIHCSCYERNLLPLLFIVLVFE